MDPTEPQPAVPKPGLGPYQFSLRTLLLLFVVLASSLAVFGGGGVVVFALVVGLAIVIRYAESWWSLVYLALVVLCLMCLLLPSARESGRRAVCHNNLKQIVLGLLNYDVANGCFPPAYVADTNGKPMHSWRVLILPYMERTPLYKAYNFAEPWDGPNNKKLLAARPMEYACPSDDKARAPGANQTSYVAVVGLNAAWAGDKSRKLDELASAGGARHTIMLVEVADSGIAWTEPRDLSLETLGAAEAGSPALVVSSHHGPPEDFFFIYDRSSDAHVAMADGSVSFLSFGSVSPEDLREVLQVGGFKERDRSYDSIYRAGRRLNWPNIAALAVWLLSVGTLLTGAVRSRKAKAQPTPPAGMEEPSPYVAGRRPGG